MPTLAGDPKLEELNRQLRRERASRSGGRIVSPARPRGWISTILIGAAKACAVVVIPLAICVRLSVDLYLRGTSTSVAVATAATVAALLIAIYAASVARRLVGKASFISVAKWVAMPLVVGWCVYALFYLASANAKTDDVRRSYTELHPILRIALSTLILADGDLVITDASRVPEDYRRMGLPIFDRTMHYRQSDDWVHAVDLRTKGHGELRNKAVQAYFSAMGFSTLRHVGTADHLHVQLPRQP